MTLDSVDIRIETPKALKDALAKNNSARRIFEKLAPSRKKQFLWWIESAKRDDTRERRVI